MIPTGRSSGPAVQSQSPIPRRTPKRAPRPNRLSESPGRHRQPKLSTDDGGLARACRRGYGRILVPQGRRLSSSHRIKRTGDCLTRALGNLLHFRYDAPPKCFLRLATTNEPRAALQGHRVRNADIVEDGSASAALDSNSRKIANSTRPACKSSAKDDVIPFLPVFYQLF